MKPKVLSKSKLMRGLQCEKSLWLTLHEPSLEADVTEATQAQFDQGNEVGELAREHFGQGLLIDAPIWNFAKGHELTQNAIEKGERVIFEASFLADGYFARADILHWDKKGWHLIEVKKSTKVKDEHVDDVGIQSFIIESCGVKLETISVMHINTDCEFPDLDELFTIVDITEQIREGRPAVKKKMAELKKVAVQKAEPQIGIGPQCSAPYDCGFRDHCWKAVPEKSVFDLPSINSDEKWALYNDGKIRIKDLKPTDFKGKTKRAIEVTKTGETFIDAEKIVADLADWEWPLYFFDFETLNPPVPRFKKSHPYLQLPFQFSCHVWKSRKEKSIGHFEYLHTDETDPRPPLIEAMLEGLGTKGSIVSYHKSFEITRIKELAKFDSKNRKALLELCDRFVDPLPIFRENVYHQDFLGSFSIKFVAPALIGEKLSYDSLDVGDGGTAQALAEQMLRGKITGPAKEKLIEDLLKYCRQDTMAMVELVKWLFAQAK